MITRYLEKQVGDDLKSKMVFVGGPRQVGKTTLARQLLSDERGYLSYDVPEHREQILRRELPDVPLLVFDEIHKYRRWRNYLKGLYDGPGAQRILVTGSARLEHYRFGGDSLQGRYHYLRLHPLSVAELDLRTSEELSDLLLLGGFPEPFLAGSERFSRRWSRSYRDRLVREEITSLERVNDLGQLELLMLRLPEVVGSPLSINSLSGDLQVSHKTLSRWLSILENLYAIFRIPPFGAPRLRALKKAQKHYQYDWTLVAKKGQRFENLVAAQLLKWVHHQQDVEGLDMELRYFRDVDGREVDFVLTLNRKPMTLIECKWSDAKVDRGLRYLKKRFPSADAWQLSATGTKHYRSPDDIRVSPAIDYLRTLV